MRGSVDWALVANSLILQGVREIGRFREARRDKTRDWGFALAPATGCARFVGGRGFGLQRMHNEGRREKREKFLGVGAGARRWVALCSRSSNVARNRNHTRGDAVRSPSPAVAPERLPASSYQVCRVDPNLSVHGEPLADLPYTRRPCESRSSKQGRREDEGKPPQMAPALRRYDRRSKVEDRCQALRLGLRSCWMLRGYHLER